MSNIADAVVAGSNEIYGFNTYFTGDTQSYNEGSNGRHTIGVESAGANDGVARPYRLDCESGSGHTPGDRVNTGSGHGPAATAEAHAGPVRTGLRRLPHRQQWRAEADANQASNWAALH